MNKAPRFMREYASWKINKLNEIKRAAAADPDIYGDDKAAHMDAVIAAINKTIHAYEVGTVSINEAMIKIGRLF